MTRGRRSAVVMTYSVFCLLLVAAFAPLTDDEEGRADLPVRMAAESFTATIEVNVTDNVGRPVGDALVTLEDNETYTSVETDEYGRLTIPGLLADTNGTEYNLSAQCDGYLELAKVSVTVTPFNTSWVNLTVRGGGIYGTVFGGGLPLWQANISIDGTDLNISTGVDGTYTFHGMKSGTYWVTANATYYKSLSKQITVPLADYVPLHFFLESLTGSISGMVLHMETEEPLKNASVAVTIEDYTIVYYSGTDGTYTVPNIPPGTYSITVSLTGFNTTVVENILVVSGATTDGVDVLLSEKLPSISGRIIHSSTQEPLEGANVSIAIEDYTITVRSNASGSYRFWDIPPGTYSITVSLEGFNTTVLDDVEVVSGVTTKDVDILLSEKPTILSGVVKSGSVLLVGANVSLVGTSLYGVSSIDGEYEIRGIPVGTYTVAASLQGYDNTTILNVQIDRGLEVRLNINLTGKLGGTLYGIVVDESTGDELSGVRVTLLPLRETITNIHGEFQFTGLGSGEYTLLFILEDYGPIEMGDITVSSENFTDLGLIGLHPVRESFGGFIFGFDLAHSMMIVALFLTIVILALAVVLRIRSFEAPDRAPAVYDELESEDEERADKAAEEEDSKAHED